MAAKRELVSQAEFSRRSGMSRSRIRTLIRQKKLKLISGRIDPERANHQLEKHLHPARSGYRKHGPVPQAEPSPEPPESPSQALSFSAAQTEKETYAAKLKRLEYDREIGTLIPVDQVRSQVFLMARLARDAVLKSASRIDAMVAVESDRMKCRRIIIEELRRALSSLADDEIERRLSNGRD